MQKPVTNPCQTIPAPEPSPVRGQTPEQCLVYMMLGILFRLSCVVSLVVHCLAV